MRSSDLGHMDALALRRLMDDMAATLSGEWDDVIASVPDVLHLHAPTTPSA